ncbi:MAG: 17 kDa surface antigen precursor [Francisellaceae bacterium]|nr:17 kDa surface antigen precursor [Francisellaceae bacterium]
MFMKMVSCVLLLGIISGCANNQGPNQMGGTIIGGAAGALVGSQFGRGTGAIVGTGIGAIIGATAGSSLGQEMDQRNKELR